jgi:hypothetical protein
LAHYRDTRRRADREQAAAHASRDPAFKNVTEGETFFPVVYIGQAEMEANIRRIRAATEDVLGSDAWPARPLTMVIGFAAGGSTDLQGRALAKSMEAYLGQPVNVLNRPGAGSATAYTELKSNTDEGYTFLYGGTTALSAG